MGKLLRWAVLVWQVAWDNLPCLRACLIALAVLLAEAIILALVVGIGPVGNFTTGEVDAAPPLGEHAGVAHTAKDDIATDDMDADSYDRYILSVLRVQLGSAVVATRPISLRKEYSDYGFRIPDGAQLWASQIQEGGVYELPPAHKLWATTSTFTMVRSTVKCVGDYNMYVEDVAIRFYVHRPVVSGGTCNIRLPDMGCSPERPR